MDVSYEKSRHALLSKLDALVVTYDSADHILECIAAVQRTCPLLKLQIIDNASSDKTRKLLRGIDNCTIQSNRENRKLSAVWNSFLHESTAEFVLLLNPDVIIQENAFLEQSLEILSSRGNVAGAGWIHRVTLGSLYNYRAPVSHYDKNIFFDRLSRSNWFIEKLQETPDWRDIIYGYLDGCCMVLHRQRVLSVGGFAEDLPLYFNDTELCFRLFDAGLEIASTWAPDDGSVLHSEHGSAPARSRIENGTTRKPLSLRRPKKILKKIVSLRRRQVAWKPEGSDPASFPHDGQGRFLNACFSALRWIGINSNRSAGIGVSSSQGESCAASTGYLIPTLLNFGKRSLALQYGRWLLSVQKGDGSWSGPPGTLSSVLDTGQVLRGLLQLVDILPQAREQIKKGGAWLLKQVQSNNWIVPRDKTERALRPGEIARESMALDILKPLRMVGECFDDPAYVETSDRALRYFLSQPRPSRFNTLSHLHAQVLGALLELGCKERVEEEMESIEEIQHRKGFVPACPNSEWVSSAGLAQYALIWFQLGIRQPGLQAFDYLCRLQNPSGGFYGGYGVNASYFPRHEITSAVKLFLDAQFWLIRSVFEKQTGAFSEIADENDGCLRLILEQAYRKTPRRILDVGCGKGRFAKVLLNRFPGSEIWGLDLAETLLSKAPKRLRTRQGSMLNQPFPDDSFDFVYSVEALEHSLNPVRAIRELCRVLRPGGRLLIIARSAEKKKDAEEWEQSFGREQIEAALKQHCKDVWSEFVSRDGKTADGSLLAWGGTKVWWRSLLATG